MWISLSPVSVPAIPVAARLQLILLVDPVPVWGLVTELLSSVTSAQSDREGGHDCAKEDYAVFKTDDV